MPMPREVEQVCQLLRGLPVEDQLACLLIAIVQAIPDGLDVSMRILGATVKLSANLSDDNGFAISEKLRDAADVTKQPKVQRRVEIKLITGCRFLLFAASTSAV